MNKKRIVLGITGGIATGKSTVMQALSHAGIPTVSSDALAHEAIRRGRPAYGRILRHFGDGIVDFNGQINRRRLGAIVFADPRKRKLLERIVHPYVIRHLREFVLRNTGLIALDIPLLFEAHLTDIVDVVVVVYAPQALQMRRLLGRDGLTATEARRRLAAQYSLREKCRRADVVLRNTRGRGFLYHQVRRLLQNLKCA